MRVKGLQRKDKSKRSCLDLDLYSRYLTARREFLSLKQTLKEQYGEIRDVSTDYTSWVKSIALKLGISETSHDRAIEILDVARAKLLTSGKSPRSLAAAALYIACLQNNEHRTQRDLAGAVGVTEVTVRNNYQFLWSHLNLEESVAQNETEKPADANETQDESYWQDLLKAHKNLIGIGFKSED
jgi:transcription initiation factor TFIIIB Brf1 subunit/transcription initiation factor TFIIB